MADFKTHCCAAPTRPFRAARHVGKAATKYCFEVFIHRISANVPKPTTLSVEWIRGPKRTATKEHRVLEAGGSTVEWRESLRLISTLFKNEKSGEHQKKPSVLQVFSVLPNKHGKGSHKTPLGEYRFDLGQFNDCVDGCVETLTCLLARCRDPNATITFSVTGTALESGDADLASIAQEPCLASLDLDAPTPDELEVMRKLREQREKTRQRDRGRSRSRRRKSGDGTEGADDETVDGPGPGTLLRRRSLDERGVPKPRSLSRIPSFGPAFETSPTGMPSFNLPVRNSEKDKEREAGETEKGKGNTALPPLPPDVAQAAERGDAAVLIGRLRVLEKELQEKDSEMFRLKAEHRKEVNSLEEKIRQEQEKGRELEAGHAEQLREKDVQIEKLLEALEQLQEATSTERETPDDDLDEDDRPEGFSFPFRTLNEENERRMASPSSAPERAGEDPNRQLLEDSTFTFKESDLDAAAEIVAESSTPQQKQTSPDGEDEEAEEGENQNIPREATTPPPPERVSTLERLAFGDHHQETQDAPNGEEQGQGQPPYEVHVVSAEGDRRQIAPRDREGTGARSPKSAPSVASERSRRSGRTFRSSRSAAHSVTVVDTVLRAQLEDLKGRLEVKSQRLEECEHRLSELQTEQTRQISEIEAEWEEKCSALQRRVEDMGGEAALSEEEVKDRDRALRNEKEMREKAEKTLADLRATLIDAAAEADEEEDGEEGGRALFSDVGPAGGEEEGGEGEGMQRRSAQTARPTSPRAAAVAMRRQVASMAAEIAELQAINASLQEEKESAISVHRHEIEILQREARDAAEQAQQYISKLQREIAALEERVAQLTEEVVRRPRMSIYEEVEEAATTWQQAAHGASEEQRALAEKLLDLEEELVDTKLALAQSETERDAIVEELTRKVSQQTQQLGVYGRLVGDLEVRCADQDRVIEGLQRGRKRRGIGRIFCPEN